MRVLFLTLALCATSVLCEPSSSASKSPGTGIKKKPSPPYAVYRDDDFDTQAEATLSREGRGIFLFLSASWCGHCKKLNPTWKQLASDMKRRDGAPVVAKVDAVANRYVSSRFSVRGYPTLVFIRPDGSVTRYGGRWDLESLTRFALHGHADSEYEDIDLFGGWTLFLARWRARIQVLDDKLLEIQKWSTLSAPWFRVVAAPTIMTIILTLGLGSYGLFYVGRSYLYAYLGWPDPDAVEAARWRAQARETKRRREAAIRGADGVKMVPVGESGGKDKGGEGRASRRKGKGKDKEAGERDEAGNAAAAESKKDK